MADDSSGTGANEEPDQENASPDPETDWITSPPPQPDSPTADRDTAPPNWVEKGTFIVLIVTFVAAGWAAHEAGRLADLTGKAIEDAHTASTESLARADAANVNGQRAYMEANRAWLAPIVSLEDKGDHYNLQVQVANLGKQPGIDIAVSGQDVKYVMNYADQRRIDWPKANLCEGLAPVSRGPVSWPFPANSTNQLFTFNTTIPKAVELVRANEQAIANGSHAVIVFGCITYVTFGEEHHSQYCAIKRMTVDGLKWGPCGEGQYAD